MGMRRRRAAGFGALYMEVPEVDRLPSKATGVKMSPGGGAELRSTVTERKTKE
jgi:hypothetical protein